MPPFLHQGHQDQAAQVSGWLLNVSKDGDSFL